MWGAERRGRLVDPLQREGKGERKRNGFEVWLGKAIYTLTVWLHTHTKSFPAELCPQLCKTPGLQRPWLFLLILCHYRQICYLSSEDGLENLQKEWHCALTVTAFVTFKSREGSRLAQWAVFCACDSYTAEESSHSGNCCVWSVWKWGEGKWFLKPWVVRDVLWSVSAWALVDWLLRFFFRSGIVGCFHKVGSLSETFNAFTVVCPRLFSLTLSSLVTGVQNAI